MRRGASASLTYIACNVLTNHGLDIIGDQLGLIIDSSTADLFTSAKHKILRDAVRSTHP